MSSRKPSFNASNFGSPSFVDRTLTTSKIINSPFYNGSTIYGGASAYGKQLGISESRQQQLKNSYRIQPVNKSSDTKSFTSLSKTARRILETLEQCSTPMSDVKKIPLPTRTEKQGVFSRYVAANPYKKNPKVSNRELLVPSVSERLKMKQMQRLQDTTNEIRQIVNSSSSNLNSKEYKVAIDTQQMHTNKMKSKITSVRNKAPTIEVLDDYILNPVPLMIPENKYPTFEIPNLNIGGIKEDKVKENKQDKEGNETTPKQNAVVAEKDELNTDKNKPESEENLNAKIKNNTNIQNENTKKELFEEYIFSKPLVIADNSKSIIAINNFKFSEPLPKKIKLTEKDGEKVQKEFQSNETIKMTNGNISCDVKTVDLKKHTDPLLVKFKPPEGTWECQTCLIRNKSEVTKCAACETSRVEKDQIKKNDLSSSFGLQFSKKTDEWDCSICLVRNKVQNNVCVACSSPKVSKPETNGIGNKALTKEWECDTCWIRNKSESIKCVACETMRKDSTSKINNTKTISKQKCKKCFDEIKEIDGKCTKCEKVKFDFPSHLKPSSDTWECGTCLIRNKTDLKNCAACETPRVLLNSETQVESLVKKSDKWECPTCMVKNDSDVEKCPCCETVKPGVTLISKSNVNIFNFGVNKTQFSFGIPKDMQNTNPSPISSTLFANNTNGSSTSNTGFKFGIEPETKDNSKTEQLNSSSLESKSERKQDSNSSTSQATHDKNEKSDTFKFKTPSIVSDKTSLPEFKFGAPVSDSKELSKGAAAPDLSFKFTPPKSIAMENKIFKSPSSDVKKAETNLLTVPSVSQADSKKPSLSFGNKDNDSKEQASKPMFSFGSSSSTQPGGFNFNSVKTDSTQQSANSTGFASTTVQPLQSTNSGGAALKNGGFNFGSNASSSQAAVFSFGAAQNLAQTTPLAKGGFDFSSAVSFFVKIVWSQLNSSFKPCIFYLNYILGLGSSILFHSCLGTFALFYMENKKFIGGDYCWNSDLSKTIKFIMFQDLYILTINHQ